MEEERTRNYLISVTNKVNDYDTLKNEFENEKKKFNKKIKDLERENRRLNGIIRKKNEDIEMLQSEKKILEGTIVKKDKHIDKLEDLMADLRFTNSDLTNKLEEEQELNKEIIEGHNHDYMVYSRKMQEKDDEISRIFSSKSKLQKDYLREIKEFDARDCTKDTKVFEISNENARLKEEILKLKEFEMERADNIQKEEVNENDEQCQTDEDNSEKMNSWYRSKITALYQISNDEVTNDDLAELYNR
ncbi:13866_t:CDS:2, partial [Gigaspora margarita]